MTLSRPYLLRAIHEWIVDNDLTPHILVDASREGTVVPTHLVEDGKIVFNIGPRAVSTLQMRNDAVEFEARFGGSPMHVHLPILAVLAIYARENGKGMIFTEEEGTTPPTPPEDAGADKTKRPSLRVVK
jgi:stringent starvation protein B